MNYLFKLPFDGYGYAICGGPANSVLAPIGEWTFIWTTPHNRDASDSKKATCVSDAPSKMQLKHIHLFEFLYIYQRAKRPH